MIVEMTDAAVEALKQQGWSIRRGRKSYIVSPDGSIRHEILRSEKPINLYVLHAERSNRFKIGIAANPRERMRTLQIGSAGRLELAWSGPIASRATESLAHETMKQQHCHGEWFDMGSASEWFCRQLLRCDSADDVLSVLGKVARGENEK